MWSDALLDASYRDIKLEVLASSLTVERDLAQHGAPYRDGDDVEDMGRRARDIALTVVYWGDNAETQLSDLLAALDKPGPGHLIHPIYGFVEVVTRRWSVNHVADKPDYVEVELQFVQRMASDRFFGRLFEYHDDDGATDEEDAKRWQDGLLDLLAQVDAFVADVQQLIGGGWVGLVENLLGLPGIALRLGQLRSQIMGIVAGLASLFGKKTHSQFDPLLELPRTPVEIRAALSAHIDPAAFDSSSSGSFSITSSSASSAEESTGSVLDEEKAELKLINERLIARENLLLVMPGAEAIEAQPARVATAVLAAARLGLAQTEDTVSAIPVGGLIFGSETMLSPSAAVAWNLVLLVVTESALAQASATIFLLDSERQAPTLAPEQLESVVSSSRALADAAIQLHRRLLGVEDAQRVIEPLRAISGIVQAAARQVLLLRPPLLEREVTSATNVRLLAHHWYGDHTRATELLRLNPKLRTPYAINAGEVLRAYVR